MVFQNPKRLFKNNDKARFVCLVLVFIAAVLFFESTGFLEGINDYCYNLAFRLRGERDHDNRILIAAIDEKTLAKLGRWPIRRSYYAGLLNYFNQAAVVGINIILSESSQDDTQLADAITRHGKVVLPAYIDNGFNISAPVKALSPAAIGHVHLEQGIDGFVREVFHRISHPAGALPSFASAIHDVINDKKLSRPEIQDNVPQHKVFDNIIQSDNRWINYYGGPGTFQYISVADILEGQWPPSFFADKIVLVGTTTAGLHEGILVPFTDRRSKMPAVEVHAHLLNNFLDNSDIRPVGPLVRWTFVTVLAVFCFFMFIKYGSLSGTFIGILSLLALTLITIIAFATFNIWLSPASPYVSIGISFLLAYFFNLQKMKTLLLQAKENWEESFNTINDAICIHDQDCNIIQANKAAEQTFGPPLLEFLKQRCRKQYDGIGDSNAGVNPKIKEEDSTEELFHPKLNRYLEIKSFPRFDKTHHRKGTVQIVRDITENKKSEKKHQILQEQLIQAQKMEAIGTLAGGIAHDFNNILAAVMGYTELTVLSLPEKSQLRAQLNHVLKASLRARDLVEQILTFSRQTSQDLQPQPIQIGLIIKEALKLIRSTFPSTIQLQLDLASDGKVVIDPSQMHQIIMNLCANAKHAMQQNGSVLTVEMKDLDIGPHAEILVQEPGLQPGPYIRLAVKDTGHGMTPEVLKRIFEPYFTTKEKGVGTGLGLAMVHGITKNCGGTVILESKVGKGTSIYVYLPRTNTDQAHKKTKVGTMAQPAPTGAERILFVDDEPELVALSREILERLGYQVVTKNNGMDALQEFREGPNHFDVVVTDMTMPKMTGERLAHELIGIRPDIPIILCTGFNEQINEQKAKAIGIKAFLMKPLTINQLAKTVRAV
ncbi:MAG: CHASE2 domain-containing protein, partial [Desulfobacterales bacterium]